MTQRTRAVRLAVPVTERDHTLGPTTAPVTLVEYGDYECPFCRRAHPVVKALRRRLADDLCFAYRHFPLVMVHPHAEQAAEAAEASGAQGKFWPMHDVLFTNQDALADEDLAGYAAALGLDLNRFVTELEEHAYAGRVREHILSGARSGVNGTPTFFINGVRYEGSHTFETMLEAVEDAIEAVGSRR